MLSVHVRVKLLRVALKSFILQWTLGKLELLAIGNEAIINQRIIKQ